MEFTPLDFKKGVLEKVFPRKNLLLRPPIANGDQLLIVMSLSYPVIDFNLLDRILIMSSFSKITPILVLNKTDEANDEQIAKIRKIYSQLQLPIHGISALEKKGLEPVKKVLENKLSILIGPSGVGKSSFLNALDSNLVLKTGVLGLKQGKGKHTTRTSMFYHVNKGLIADTPGFSRLDLPDIDKEELSLLYDDYRPFSLNCQFNGCLHHKEKKCGVKEAVDQGILDRERYNRYLYFLEELKDKEERRYK